MSGEVSSDATGRDGGSDDLRLAELVAMLALGQDNAFGQPMESQLRSCLLSLWLAEALDLTDGERDTVYWVSLLRYLGCTGHAHEAAVIFGDEIDTRARSLVYDSSNPMDVLRDIVGHVGSERSGVGRVRTVLSVLAGGTKAAELNFRTGCEVADMFAERLRMSTEVRQSIRFTFERWNGKGFPTNAKRDEIPLPMRIVHLTQEMEVWSRINGPEEAKAVARKRSNRAYDPSLVDVFLDIADELFARLDKVDPWDETLAAEPAPHRMLRGSTLDEALVVAADFVDVKSPYTAGHSRGVADLAAAAAAEEGLPDAEITTVRRAALVHDLGRTAVPNSIWDKPTSLTRAEFDRVELHPMLTEQMLRRSPGLAPLKLIAGCHHERIDGSGYSKGLAGSGLPKPARLLAAADCYHAMTEDRAFRPGRSPNAAAAELRIMADAGTLDRDAVQAVLVAAGHRVQRKRKVHPAGLTDREVEVLRLAAQGLTTKQIAERLVISAKTADHHIQHIYSKIGVSTRGAAALFAIEHDLVERGTGDG